MSMPYSFASKLIELRHKGKINTSEYEDLIKKLGRYEIEIRAKAVDDFVEKIMEYCSMSEMNRKMINQIAELMKEGAKNC